MNLVKHIINMNNRSNNSKWYISESPSGTFTAYNNQEGNKIFHNTEEFLAWFKGYSVASIKEKVFSR